MGEGDVQVRAPLPLPRRRASRTWRGASERFYWATFAVFMAGFVANAVYGIAPARLAREALGINLDQRVLSPITGGASQINIYGAIEGQPASSGRTRSRATRTTSGSSS